MASSSVDLKRFLGIFMPGLMLIAKIFALKKLSALKKQMDTIIRYKSKNV